MRYSKTNKECVNCGMESDLVIDDKDYCLDCVADKFKIGQAYEWAYDNEIVVIEPESLVDKFIESVGKE